MRILTYTALDWATVYGVTVYLADGHGCMLVSVHLDKGEATIGLEASLNYVTKELKVWKEVVLCGVWR